MRTVGAVVIGATLVVSLISTAYAAVASAPLEIIRSHIDVEVASDGSFVESRETSFRVLNEVGVQAVRQVTLSYTQQFQGLEISEAYTLKANGTRINVTHDNILNGYGASSGPGSAGFQALKTQTIVFPNVEVGDQVVLATVSHQYIPWFGKQYTETFGFSRKFVANDVSVAISTPASLALQVDAIGVQGGEPETRGGKTRRVWHFSNSTAVPPETGAVDEFDTGPRIVVSSFRDYREFADVYAGMLKDQDEVTSSIRDLADKLTANIRDDREQARALYDWVSQHIAYVNIVFGAGGFIPHRAADVLANGFGDCKDHVVLLQALLAAKGIDSSPVLINAGTRFSLSPAASPAAFNHEITYIPKWNLYADSTVRYAAFGILPYADSDKPVVRISSRDTSRTPVATADNAAINATETVNVSPDGSVSGVTQVTGKGSAAMDLRVLMQGTSAIGDAEYFHKAMGPGVDGELDRGDVNKLSDTYTFSAHYSEPNAISIPGPGAIPYTIAYKPFYFVLLVAGDLPLTRTSPYLCPAVAAGESLTIHLPPNISIAAIPRSTRLSAEGISLLTEYTRPDPRSVHVEYHLRIEHPEGTCSVAYYAGVRETLAQMTAALRSQVLYQ